MFIPRAVVSLELVRLDIEPATNCLISSISGTKQSNLFMHFFRTEKVIEAKLFARCIAYLIEKYVNLERIFGRLF